MTVGYLPAIVYPDTEALQLVLRNPHPLRHIRTNPINGTCNKANQPCCNTNKEIVHSKGYFDVHNYQTYTLWIPVKLRNDMFNWRSRTRHITFRVVQLL